MIALRSALKRRLVRVRAPIGMRRPARPAGPAVMPPRLGLRWRRHAGAGAVAPPPVLPAVRAMALHAAVNLHVHLDVQWPAMRGRAAAPVLRFRTRRLAAPDQAARMQGARTRMAPAAPRGPDTLPIPAPAAMAAGAPDRASTVPPPVPPQRFPIAAAMPAAAAPLRAWLERHYRATPDIVRTARIGSAATAWRHERSVRWLHTGRRVTIHGAMPRAPAMAPTGESVGRDAATGQLAWRSRREESGGHVDGYAAGRTLPPVSMAWRKSGAQLREGGAATPSRSDPFTPEPAPRRAVQAAVTVRSAGQVEAPPSSMNPPAQGDAVRGMPFDAASTDRLAEDVLRRVERRLRIERERRGI